MSAAIAPARSSTGLSMPEDGAVSISTEDGRALAGRLIRPTDGDVRAAIVIHGGAGIPARYYQGFATWLADTHAVAVLIYDYRDFGWSQTKPLRRSDARFSDWGRLDQSAALSHLAGPYPNAPLRVVGHSLGGQWLAFHRDIGRVDRVAAVASGPVFWRDHPASYMPYVAAFWWLLGPAATALLGYLPGRAIGLGADLPAGVYWEWRRVCLTRGFHQPEWGKSLPQPNMEAARFDLTILPVADDEMMPLAAVRRLPTFYPHARLRERLIDPAALGLGPVGHLGAFAARNNACWPLIAESVVA